MLIHSKLADGTFANLVSCRVFNPRNAYRLGHWVHTLNRFFFFLVLLNAAVQNIAC